MQTTILQVSHNYANYILSYVGFFFMKFFDEIKCFSKILYTS